MNPFLRESSPNSKKLKKNDTAISDAQSSGKCIVLFLTLQDLSKEKKRFSELFESKIDLMIIDETHFGARAETLGKVIADAHYKEDTALKQIENADGINSEALGSLQVDKAEKELEKGTKGLDVKVKLHLSGTPYRILLDIIILTLDTGTHNTLYFILSGNFL